METINTGKWSELSSLAQRGNAEAQFELGYYCEYGAIDEAGCVVANIDLLEASRWYHCAAVQGNAGAQSALSNLLSTGDGVARDCVAAVSWAKKAVAQGDASAAHNLGTIYRDQRKPAIAFRWYQRAVFMGNYDSLLQVGLCCLFGFGVKQDYVAARRHLEQINAGDPAASCQRTKEDALYWLAILQLLGIGGTRKSISRIRQLLENANSDDDHEQANELLNIIGKSEYLQPQSE